MPARKEVNGNMHWPCWLNCRTKLDACIDPGWMEMEMDGTDGKAGGKP